MKLDPEFAVETNSIEVMRHMAMMDRSITFLTPFDVEFEQLLGRLIYLPIHELRQHTQKLMLIGQTDAASVLSSIFVESLRPIIRQAAGPT